MSFQALSSLSQEERQEFLKTFILRVVESTKTTAKTKRERKEKIKRMKESIASRMPELKPMSYSSYPYTQFQQPARQPTFQQPITARIPQQIQKPTIMRIPQLFQPPQPKIPQPTAQQNKFQQPIQVQQFSIQPQSPIQQHLSYLLNDQSVKMIQAEAGKKLRIKRGMQEEEINMIINEKDIRELINKISDELRVPLADNFFSAVYKNLRINAIISDEIGSRFFITRE